MWKDAKLVAGVSVVRLASIEWYRTPLSLPLSAIQRPEVTTY